jgi:transcriptional regulator with XRE-family HTH domain
VDPSAAAGCIVKGCFGRSKVVQAFSGVYVTGKPGEIQTIFKSGLIFLANQEIWMRKVVAEVFPDPMIPDAAAFGQAVRAARTGARISLEAAAAALGISKATLGDLEGGRGTVALGTALRVARDLGVAVFAAPLAAQFEATSALRALRDAAPEQWGGVEAAQPGKAARQTVERS